MSLAAVYNNAEPKEHQIEDRMALFITFVGVRRSLQRTASLCALLGQHHFAHSYESRRMLAETINRVLSSNMSKLFTT